MGTYFKLAKINKEDETTYEQSKILGSPVFPKGFFKKHHLDDKYFVGQLNLNEIQVAELPKSGFLYFFLDVDFYPYQPKVLYTTEEVVEVYDDINEDFTDFGKCDGYQIIPTDNNTDTGLEVATPYTFNEAIDNDENYEDYLSLLALDSLELPAESLELGIPDGWYVFVIKKTDLAKHCFSKVKFMAFGS